MQSWEHWLDWLDDKPQALLQHRSEQRSTRLGIYFEQLLSFYFAHYPRFDLIAKNLQVNDNKRTLGEYDFIVYDKKQDSHYHIEVEIKFYTKRTSNTPIPHNAPYHDWHHWIGPNQRDSLGLKMRRLLQHQLRLYDTPAGNTAATALNIENLESKLLLTGRLYQHITEKPTQKPQHSDYSDDGIAFWLHPSEITRYLKASSYIVLPRQLWLSDITHQDILDGQLPCLSIEEIDQKANSQTDTEWHIAEVAQTSDGIYCEQRRFFILPR